ncbi:uncharacterized protein J3R85_011345 [Psidium guajava]|nr:uncharacterized protein J3R85_011345 [Psidium guajava]
MSITSPDSVDSIPLTLAFISSMLDSPRNLQPCLR